MLDLLEKVQGKKNYFFTGIPSASDKYNTFFFKKKVLFFTSLCICRKKATVVSNTKFVRIP